MRGLVTLATAFALPDTFPQRDLIVLTAFAVVLATLIVQGLTLAPLVRLLKLDDEDGLAAELAQARADLATAALTTMEAQTGPAADHWRYVFEMARHAMTPGGDSAPHEAKRQLGLAAMRRQRQRLGELRMQERVGADAYLILQEELDFIEVALSNEDERRIEES
jgi:CPA1 family monovalent cation:H+ antiporter